MGWGTGSSTNDPAQYTITGRPIPEYDRGIAANGWEMVGGCSDPARPSVDTCSIGVISRYVPGSGYQRILGNESLEPGKGYWMLFKDASEGCTLTVKVTGF